MIVPIGAGHIRGGGIRFPLWAKIILAWIGFLFLCEVLVFIFGR
jgi:predicted MPP superfamily phosphohydrolase